MAEQRAEEFEQLAALTAAAAISPAAAAPAAAAAADAPPPPPRRRLSPSRSPSPTVPPRLSPVQRYYRFF